MAPRRWANGLANQVLSRLLSNPETRSKTVVVHPTTSTAGSSIMSPPWTPPGPRRGGQRDLTDKAIRRGVSRSVPDLIAAIEAYLADHNNDPKPFVWTASAEQVLEEGPARRGAPRPNHRLMMKHTTSTAARYRFFAMRDELPGLHPVPRAGRVIEGELYDIPEAVLRDHLLPSEPPELTLGRIELIDGEAVNAMLLVPSRLAPGDRVVDISELGGFRAYQRFLAANAAIATTPATDLSP